MGSGTNVTVNGVTFTAEGNGATTNSGTNWTITSGFNAHLNDGWMAARSQYHSTALGNVGTYGGSSCTMLILKNQIIRSYRWTGLCIRTLQPLMVRRYP